MNRRHQRFPGRGLSARRTRPMQAISPAAGPDRRRASEASSTGAALALLSDILVGESGWTIGEVRRLISMREAAELGRWRVAGLDDDEAVAG